MNRTFTAAVAALLLAVSFGGSAAAGPLEDAGAAYEKGDYSTAMRLGRPLADQGYAGAQYMLGYIYFNGEGVPQDYATAASWWAKAAEKGLAHAQARLGIMYSEGRGVAQDHAAAVNWFRKAAERGYVEAQVLLGLKYWLGQGVPQDHVLAHMWFNLAAVGGDKDAVKGRDILAAQMTPAQIAEAQKLAREWKPK
jgi:uncharacterized protein